MLGKRYTGRTPPVKDVYACLSRRQMAFKTNLDFFKDDAVSVIH